MCTKSQSIQKIVLDISVEELSVLVLYQVQAWNYLELCYFLHFWSRPKKNIGHSKSENPLVNRHVEMPETVTRTYHLPEDSSSHYLFLKEKR